MSLFSKQYHPLDSRNASRAKPAGETPRGGTYGVILANPAQAKAQARVKAPSLGNQTKPHSQTKQTGKKLSDSARMALLAAQTQERRLKAAQRQATTSPFGAATQTITPAPKSKPTSDSPPPRKPRSRLSKAFHILTNVDRHLRIGMLIAAIIFILTQPGVLADMLGVLSSGGPVDMQQSPLKYSSDF